MIPKITINQVDLLILAEKPTLLDIYLSLLCWIGDDYCVKFSDFQSIAKPLGFKTRSGVWKALNKLQRMGLIEVNKNRIFIKGRGLYYDR